jgi:UDP-glucose:(heptosyl)LPS alpha-1,3-glucosyltransferase
VPRVNLAAGRHRVKERLDKPPPGPENHAHRGGWAFGATRRQGEVGTIAEGNVSRAMAAGVCGGEPGLETDTERSSVPWARCPMKIALVHPKVDRSGGAERYCLELAGGLAAGGHQVHVFARRAEGLPATVRRHRIPCLPLGRAVKTWSFCAASARLVHPPEFDVVQGFGKTVCQQVHRTGGAVHRAYLERTGRAGAPTLYDRVVLRIEDSLFSSGSLAAVICPSRWVADEVRRHYPAVAPKIRRVPNGVDTDAFRPEGRDRDRAALAATLGIDGAAPLLAFVATNFALKGLDDAVDALVHLPGAHLVVAGGDEQAAHRARAAEQGVAGRVHFLGAVRDPAPLYRAADALFHPTRFDPFANVCLEALACGTPVVTTTANGVADLLGDGRAGRVVPVGGPRALAEAGRALLERGGAARSDARALAVENDRGRHVGRVLEVYREVIAARGSGTAVRR